MAEHIKILYGEESLEGILIQKDPFTLKLKSGYNLLLDKSMVKIQARQQASPVPKKAIPPAASKGLKKIVILHTGGTIASKVDYSTGAVIAQFQPEEITSMYPDVAAIARITCRLIGNMQSEMMRFAHYNLMAEEIYSEIKSGADAVILTHGTDTMHYTSAALSFILENLQVPVIIVGSQRSSDRPSSDAGINLICAASFAANTSWSGVGICMHENISDSTCLILPGLKSRKMHTTRRDAFKPVNSVPIARIDYESRKIEQYSVSIKPNDKLVLRSFNENIRVGLLKTRTNLFADELLFYGNYDGLVIEGTGMGHIPNMKVDEYTKENENIFNAVKALAKKMPVAFASQCIYGRTALDVYTPGRMLKDAGVLGNHLDMTPETAYIKLSWLLSNYKKDEAARLYCTNLRGEITERSEGEQNSAF